MADLWMYAPIRRSFVHGGEAHSGEFQILLMDLIHIRNWLPAELTSCIVKLFQQFHFIQCAIFADNGHLSPTLRVVISHNVIQRNESTVNFSVPLPTNNLRTE
jgi:hypothetical protein